MEDVKHFWCASAVELRADSLLKDSALFDDSHYVRAAAYTALKTRCEAAERQRDSLDAICRDDAANQVIAALRKEVEAMRDLLTRSVPWVKRSSVAGAIDRAEYEALWSDLAALNDARGKTT